jgi:hypothetical protein
LGAGAVSSARSCAAEAQRQRRSELGCDGSAARSPVGELGGGVGRRGGELGAAVTIEEGNVQDNDMWAFIYCS